MWSLPSLSLDLGSDGVVTDLVVGQQLTFLVEMYLALTAGELPGLLVFLRCVSTQLGAGEELCWT